MSLAEAGQVAGLSAAEQADIVAAIRAGEHPRPVISSFVFFARTERQSVARPYRRLLQGIGDACDALEGRIGEIRIDPRRVAADIELLGDGADLLARLMAHAEGIQAPPTPQKARSPSSARKASNGGRRP